MYIAIPFEGRVRTLIRSSFVLAKRLSETTYNLSGDAFQMAQVTAEQALVFPDEAALEEGTALTDELLMRALPLESFVSVSAEEALPNVLGLLLRTAVADGRISDEELLAVQPAAVIEVADTARRHDLRYRRRVPERIGMKILIDILIRDAKAFV